MLQVIDRERLVQAVTGTGESAAYTFVPPQTLNYSPPLPEVTARDCLVSGHAAVTVAPATAAPL